MNRNYETVFILNPVLSEKQLENTVKKYQKQLEKNKVNFICNESLGFKNLSYPIKNKKTGPRHGRHPPRLLRTPPGPAPHSLYSIV